MSSGFVSGGTTDAPIQRSDEWLAAQQEIEANRQKKALEARQTEGKSLFEILEANKAAKQDAFEEANKIKNQFRALDEDEIEFLDSVLESTRAEEDRVKRETREGLELFRKQQEDADKKARDGEQDGDDMAQEGVETGEGEWGVPGRKRKRTRDKEVLRGVKVRRASSEMERASTGTGANNAIFGVASSVKSAKIEEDTRSSSVKSSVASAPTNSSAAVKSDTISKPVDAKKPPPPPPKKGLGLVDYGSDEDDD